MSIVLTKKLFIHNCLDCSYRFNQPSYYIVEDQYGYNQKIPYCPNCVSQNIERVEIID
jgi:ribosomal protein L37AE/L43A